MLWNWNNRTHKTHSLTLRERERDAGRNGNRITKLLLLLFWCFSLVDFACTQWECNMKKIHKATNTNTHILKQMCMAHTMKSYLMVVLVVVPSTEFFSINQSKRKRRDRVQTSKNFWLWLPFPITEYCGLHLDECSV